MTYGEEGAEGELEALGDDGVVLPLEPRLVFNAECHGFGVVVEFGCLEGDDGVAVSVSGLNCTFRDVSEGEGELLPSKWNALS